MVPVFLQATEILKGLLKDKAKLALQVSRYYVQFWHAFFLVTCLQEREIKDGKEHTIMCKMLQVLLSCRDLEIILISLVT